MPNVEFECLYCGRIWEKHIYYSGDVETEKCSKCNDSNVKASKESEKIDYYGERDKK